MDAPEGLTDRTQTDCAGLGLLEGGHPPKCEGRNDILRSLPTQTTPRTHRTYKHEHGGNMVRLHVGVFVEPHLLGLQHALEGRQELHDPGRRKGVSAGRGARPGRGARTHPKVASSSARSAVSAASSARRMATARPWGPGRGERSPARRRDRGRCPVILPLSPRPAPPRDGTDSSQRWNIQNDLLKSTSSKKFQISGMSECH